MKKLFLSFIIFFIQFSNAQEKGLNIDFLNILDEQETSPGAHIYLGYSDMIFSQNFSEQSNFPDSIVVLLVHKFSNDSTYHYFDSGIAENYFGVGENVATLNFTGNYYNTQFIGEDNILMTNMYASDINSNQVLVTLVFDFGNINDPILRSIYKIGTSVFDFPSDIELNPFIDNWTPQESKLVEDNRLLLVGNFSDINWQHAGSFILKYDSNDGLDIKYFWTYNSQSNLNNLVDNIDYSNNWSTSSVGNALNNYKPRCMYYRWSTGADTLITFLKTGHELRVAYDNSSQQVDTLVYYDFQPGPNNNHFVDFHRMRLDAYAGHNEGNHRWIISKQYGEYDTDLFMLTHFEFDHAIQDTQRLNINPNIWNLSYSDYDYWNASFQFGFSSSEPDNNEILKFVRWRIFDGEYEEHDINLDDTEIGDNFDNNWVMSDGNKQIFQMVDMGEAIQVSAMAGYINGVDVQQKVYFRGKITQEFSPPRVNPIHVDISSGSDETGDGTESNPYASIQMAVDTLESGDTIIVHPGLYIENIHVQDKQVYITSLYQPGQEYLIDNTILNGNLEGTVIEFSRGVWSDELSIINGFTITGGQSGQGGGVNSNSTRLEITNCRITGNYANSGEANAGGGGIAARLSSQLYIQNTIIDNNQGSKGGGIMIFGGSLSISESKILNNNGIEGGGIFSDNTTGNTYIGECLFDGNIGGAIKLDELSGDTTRIDFSTFVNNKSLGEVFSSNAGGSAMFLKGNFKLSNSVLWDNFVRLIDIDNNVVDSVSTSPIKYSSNASAMELIIENSDIEGGIEGVIAPGANTQITAFANVLNENPLFCSDTLVQFSPDFSYNGYYIAENSPCYGSNFPNGYIGFNGVGCGNVFLNPTIAVDQSQFIYLDSGDYGIQMSENSQAIIDFSVNYGSSTDISVSSFTDTIDVTTTISQTNDTYQLSITPSQDWSGYANVFITVDDGMYQDTAHFIISVIPGGEPSIVAVQDIPQDQGGFVGIQFSGSYFDGSSNAYTITHYSIWRDLNVDGSISIEANSMPIGRYFRPQGMRDNYYWEYVGQSPAQGFGNYGYIAPTIADSNHIGMFTSTFLLVAHTDDEQVFFLSEPASGYSIDNIPPADPSNVSFQTFTYTTTLSWDTPVDEDYAYTEVRRNGGVLASGSTFNQFVDESLAPGESYSYDIVHIDENGNESRNETRDMTAPEWYFELTTQAENASNSIFYFAGNDMASMGYDPGYDLPAPPAPPGESVRMISYNPAWDNVLGDEYSYISIENEDYMNFNRSVDLEVHSDINDTIPVSVVPYGNLSAMDDFLVYINDELVTDQMNGFYGGSFNLPVSDSTITYVTLVAGNPEGSDGHIQSLTFTDEMVLSVGGDYQFDLVTTSDVWQIDIWWSIDGVGANPWRDNMVVDAMTNRYTESFDPGQFLSTFGYHDGYMTPSPNIDFIFWAEDVNGNRIDTLRSAQVTLISDNISMNYEEAGWYLVSPYFVGTDFGDWFNGIDEGSVLYSWNPSMQSYELLNGSDTSFTEGQAMWLGSPVPQVVNYFGDSPELYETKKTVVENNPGWIMTGGSARHVRMDSIIVKLQNISSTTLPDMEYSWAEAVEAGIVQNTIIAFENMIGDYEPVEYTKLGQGFWIGLLENGYEETHQVVFEFPPHYVDFEVTFPSRDLAYDWGFTLNNLVFGYSALASNEYDSFDIVSPPTPRAYGIYMRINNEEWNSPLGNSYLSDIRNSIGDDNIAEYEVKFVGTGDYEINTEHFNVPDSLVVTLHLGDESYDLTSNPLVTISVVDGQTGTVSVSPAGTLSNDMDASIPQIFALHQNYPNPFNPTTSISYDLPKNEFVSINVFDLMGREVKTLVNKEQVAGFRSVKWDATNNLGQPVSAGMYIYTIQAGEFRQTRKMVLLK